MQVLAPKNKTQSGKALSNSQEAGPKKSAPKTDLVQLTKRRRTQLLDVLLQIVGIGLLILIFTTQLASLFTFDFSQPALVAEVCAGIIIVICYILNRLKYSYIAAMLFFFCISILIFFFLISLPDSRIYTNIRVVPTLLIVPVVAAGVIIRPFYSFIFSGLCLAGLVILAVFRSKPGLTGLQTPLETISNLDVAICLLIIMAGMAWFFEHNIQNLIRQLADQNRSLVQLNRQLHYKQQFETHLNSEIQNFTGAVAQAFEKQQDSSRTQMLTVREMNTTSADLDELSEEITATSQIINNTIEQALNISETGSLKVKYSVQSLIGLNQQVEEIHEAMTNFYQQTSQINQIAELIDEIAEQTGLLSLNASIEAAGAGENGQRFRAIAKEVQRLSERSQEASREVKVITLEIQRALEETVSLTERGQEATDIIVTDTRILENDIADITTIVQNAATLAYRISDSTLEQRNAIKLFVSTLKEIAAFSENVVQNNQRIIQNLEQLNRAVNKLNG